MVKNACGGNKSKGLARKNVVSAAALASGGGGPLRVSQDTDETYVRILRMLGGSLCEGCTLQGHPVLCHIRGKFRGKRKRDNIIKSGTWVLVGMHSWESVSEGKKRNADILEVYSDSDKMRLRHAVPHLDWDRFVFEDARLCSTATTSVASVDFEFADESTLEYETIAAAAAIVVSLAGSSSSSASLAATARLISTEEGTCVDVNDI